MKTVPLRELNHHSGSIVREVQRTGESVLVTDRGVAIAQIQPLAETAQQRLARIVTQPSNPSATLPPARPSDLTSTDLLDEIRGDR